MMVPLRVMITAVRDDDAITCNDYCVITQHSNCIQTVQPGKYETKRKHEHRWLGDSYKQADFVPWM
jgi:hypothetical protein